MTFILRKRKNRIGKLIAATKYIAVQSMGEPCRKTQIENMSKIVENLAEIALEVGGERFAMIEVPACEHSLELTLERRRASENR